MMNWISSRFVSAFLNRATLGLCVLAISGCAELTAPDSRQAYDAAMPSPLPEHWATSAAAVAFRPEWLGFDSRGELQGLIDEADERNPDMHVAATRVEQARLQAQLAGAALMPTISTGGKLSNSLISTDALSLSGVYAAASWEVDVWGVARAGVRASEARYRSAEADYVYARASLGAAVAKAWLLNIETTRALSLLEAMDADTARQRDIVMRRVEVGKASSGDLAEVEARVQASRERVIGARQARESAQRSLELLLGRYPSAQIEVHDTAALFVHADLPPVPVGVPLDVLDRRPDLIASRNAMTAAFFGAEQAKAARLPNITLTAGAGYFDTRAGAWRDQIGGLVFPIGAKVTWPLFDAGRRQTEYDIATVAQSEAAARYAKSILRAMGEVENALAAERDFGARATALDARRDTLTRNADLVAVQRDIGRADTYDTLAARIEATQSQIAADQARVSRYAARIDLHLVLGGRFIEAAGS